MRNEEIENQAAEWAVKLASGPLAPEERAKFDSWRQDDIRHGGALLRADAILARLDRLATIGVEDLTAEVLKIKAVSDCDFGGSFAGEKAEPVSADGRGEAHDAAALKRPLTPPSLFRRRIVLAGGMAASIAVLGGLGLPLLQGRSELATQVGETRHVGLSDGSAVTLNTNTRMEVRFSKNIRAIDLEQGEAIFTVAKNKNRPFVVRAGNANVRAVGTRFTVRLLPGRPVQVVVQEGVVEITRSDMLRTKPARATADTQAVVAVDTPTIVQPVAPQIAARELAWQYGKLSFENRSLAEAADEFARYTDKRIIVDPAVANRTITGLYASNDPVGFAQDAATVLGLHVEVAQNEVRISANKPN